MFKKKKESNSASTLSKLKRIFKKKKTTGSDPLSSTFLATPKDTSVVPISSPSTIVRFFKQDPTLIQENDLRVHETINNTQELAYWLQQYDLSPDKTKFLKN